VSGPRAIRSVPIGARSVEVPYEAPAPSQDARYLCARGHAFTITLSAAADVDVPAGWDCRCGAPAARAGKARARGGQAPGDASHERCMALLLMRRSRAELDVMLAGRLAELADLRSGGGPR
jgi:hypothetical protein